MVLNPVATWGKETFIKISRIPLVFILIAIEVYFWINGPAHFPAWDEGYGNIIMIYIIMTIIFLMFRKQVTEKQMFRPIDQSIPWFTFFFIGTYMIMLLASFVGLFEVGSLPSHLFWPTVILQVCVVATAEELMFRGVMLSYFGVIISSAMFAVWHGYAYGVVYYAGVFQLSAVFFAFIMGLILAMVAKNKIWGLAAAIGIHSAYNLYVSGAFLTF